MKDILWLKEENEIFFVKVNTEFIAQTRTSKTKWVAAIKTGHSEEQYKDNEIVKILFGRKL